VKDLQFGAYRIVEPLGEGGMATVFKAYQANMERHVAIKVLPRQLAADPQFQGRFQQEALVVAKLQHPHILPVFDFGESDGCAYLVMPLVESGSLKGLLQGRPLPLGQVRDLISQVGDALDYAHSRGLVHRDIKPGNVLLDGRGNCLLADFGIAKIIEATAHFTATGGTVGTPAYMSPEQGRGDAVDARTDVYALGVVLYEMVTGQVPFEAETPVAVIFKHIEEPLPKPRALNPSLPEAVERVIVKALAKDPQERYASAGEMVRALQAAIPTDRGELASRVKPSVPPTTMPPARQSSLVLLTSHVARSVTKSVVSGSGLLWVLLLASLVLMAIAVGLSAVYASEYGFLQVPFASWFIFICAGLILALNGSVVLFWRRYRRASAELNDLRGQPLESGIPAVVGHEDLTRSQFVPIIQTLFQPLARVRFIQVSHLPGGHGGGATVLARLMRRRDESSSPRAFVVKLGDKREMDDEHDKFQRYVLVDLAQAARFFRYATWGEWAGVAYEFVGLDPGHEIQSLYQFYQGYATLEVVRVVARALQHLERAWYRRRQLERVDLYPEYGLLSKKRDDIVGHIAEIVAEDDPYRANFTAVERRLQPHLKPDFCPDPSIPWHDPVTFLRTWSGRSLNLSVSRSVVHGDLHARNVLVEVERSGTKRVWFIDFSHTGNGLSQARTREASRERAGVQADRGHTLRDFCRLEADVKFLLTTLRDEQDLKLAVAFERELMRCGLALDDLSSVPPPIEALRQERFSKAWMVIREIRRQAAAYLTYGDDLRPFYLSLLHATLPLVYYRPAQFESKVCEQQQKRYALLSAGMLCSSL
jgi:serine/threonine protein kinase